MKIKKLTNETNPKLKLAYTDKRGNKWFGLINPLTDLSPARGIAGSRAERYVGLMISEKELDLALDEMIKSFKDMDIAKAGAIAYDLKHRRKFLVEEKSTLDLAGIYFFLNDEDPKTYSEIDAEKKRVIWEDDAECKGFFLRMGFALTKKFPNMSENDLLEFMEQTKTIAERLYQHIPTAIQRSNNMPTT